MKSQIDSPRAPPGILQQLHDPIERHTRCHCRPLFHHSCCTHHLPWLTLSTAPKNVTQRQRAKNPRKATDDAWHTHTFTHQPLEV
ncbi:hypothetical protein Hamer_G029406 [Homarus americanus]|uniref:Uncharacterized protein n=1 Tax=Homarus americanus TaxID=6706 RepID=A0A8J5MK05_HOMAM|nr:hypothetical protein Hamer_G029406 [Homarus americanus]